MNDAHSSHCGSVNNIVHSSNVMLVQLSPFKTVKTSIKLSATSRRRKRNETDVSDLPAEASYITTSSRRGQLKWKHHSEEFVDNQPLILLSSDHQISTVGRSKDQNYEEISSLHYSSRPGNVTSFAPTLNGKTSDKLPRIPPILDAKNDQVYAFQHGNNRLCCWNALQANGPDEKQAIKVDLSQPAVSMSLLPLHKGVVYGTCIDGTVFVARLGTDREGKEGLSVEYLPNKLPNEQKHVGTLAELPQGQSKGVGRKRKMSDADGRTNVYFFQVFHDSSALHLVRHDVQFERFSTVDHMIVESSVNRQALQIPLTSGKDEILLNATVNTCSSDASKVSITFQVKHMKENSTTSFCTLLSLAAGDLTHCRVQLPTDTMQYGMISDSILVTASQQSLSLLDLETGSTLHTASMPADFHDLHDSWLLRTDSKNGSLVILHERDSVLVCAISSLMLDEHHESLAKTKLSLASKLASSVLDAQLHSCVGSTMIVHNILSLYSTKGPEAEQIIQQTIHESLESLEMARIKSISPSIEDLDPFIFMKTYESAVSTLLTAVTNSTPSIDSLHDQHNPQDGVNCTNGHGKLNGVAKKLTKNGLNGLNSPLLPHARALTPPTLPQAFIDGATQIVMKLLQTEPTEDRTLGRRIALARLDARMILCRLLHTGKLSARLHFDGTESIQSSTSEHKLTSALRSVKLSNKRGRRYFTPVDMMMTMLQKCPDVSERQMVVMLSYMVRRALPEDIAEMFIDERKYHLHTQHVGLARKYFSVRTNLLKASGPTDQVKSPELERLAHRLILAGTSYLLHRIVSYSQCNEPMLRVALHDVIEKHEAIVLARILANMLASTRKKDVISKAPPGVIAMKSICQWIAALCDCFHDELAAARGANGRNYLSVLLGAVTLTTKHSQEIISLKEDVQRVETDIQAKLLAKNTPVAVRVLAKQEDLPGYVVETLTF